MFFFQEWWNSLGARSQTVTRLLLRAIVKNFPDIPEEDLDPVVTTILGDDPAMLTDERQHLLEEFIPRFGPIFEVFDDLLEKSNPGTTAEMVQIIDREIVANIEIKATILGILLKETNTIGFLTDLACKIIKNTAVDYAKEFEKLTAESKELEAKIQTCQIAQDESRPEAYWEWEMNLEGCPNMDCQYVNPTGAEKCQKCGIVLLGECPECYNEIPLPSSYCRVCGKSDLENWNIASRFTVSVRLAMEQRLYTKAYSLLASFPGNIKQYPELLLFQEQVEKVVEKPKTGEEELQLIAEEVRVLSGKWVSKIKELLAEKHPDFILASKVLTMIPPYLQGDEIGALSQDLELMRQRIVQQGRARKRSLLLQEIELLQQKKAYQKALGELVKWLPTFTDATILGKKEELEKQLAQAQKAQKLLEGPAWANPGNWQKEIAVQENLAVVREFDLGSGVTIGFILIPAGSFMMGCEDGYEQERPVHKVTLRQPFYLAATPVTQSQWRAILGSNPSRFRGDKLPAEQLSWDESGTFLLGLTKKFGEVFRLPTEAEWEYACRAATTTPFFFGEDTNLLDHYAWFKSDAKNESHEVATKKANPWGLYDMIGNVWEWCQDIYDDKYYQKSPAQDPMGPAGSKSPLRVCRGGSWKNIPSDLRSATRQGNPPGSRYDNVGLRPVLAIKKK